MADPGTKSTDHSFEQEPPGLRLVKFVVNTGFLQTALHMPEKTDILRIVPDAAMDAFAFIVQHPSFDPILAGQVIPVIVPSLLRKPNGETEWLWGTGKEDSDG